NSSGICPNLTRAVSEGKRAGADQPVIQLISAREGRARVGDGVCAQGMTWMNPVMFAWPMPHEDSVHRKGKSPAAVGVNVKTNSSPGDRANPEMPHCGRPL